MKICVLNASNPNTIHLEADEYVDYRDGRKSCFNDQEIIKKCSSWHSWAYALETEFFVYKKNKWEGCYQYDGVIILVNRNIEQVIPLVKKLKLMKKKVAISLHEGGQDLLGGSGIPNENIAERWINLFDIVKEADCYINIFEQLNDFFEGWFGEDKVRYCSQAAPVDWEYEHTFSWGDRPYDILIGTRTLNQRLSRNTLITLGAVNGIARKYGYKVNYLSEDGDVSGLLKRIGIDYVNVIRGPLSWSEWLKFVEKHRLLVHFDQSLNLGQICYDAAIVGTIPIGSTTSNNMWLGTDDFGDTHKLCKKIVECINNESIRNIYFQRLSDFRKLLIHPNVVKENLLRTFEEI